MDPLTLETLRTIPLFAGVADGHMSCLEPGEIIQLEAGKVLVAEGDPVESFYVVLEGELRVSRNYSNQAILMGIAKPGTFMGEVPLLLDSPTVATVRALKPSRLFRLGKDDFWQMLTTCPSVANQIFRTMATRVRNIEVYSQQRERLASLGTMAAGLAHELNNPATAARRASAHLREVVEEIQSFACQLHHRLNPEQWQSLIGASQNAAAKSATLDAVARSDREEEIATWLEKHGVADTWKLAPAFVSAGTGSEELSALTGKLPRE